MRPSQQQTLGAPVEFEGLGLHMGQPGWVRISPAPADHGIRLLLRGTEVPAVAERVVSTQRCTTLGTAEGESGRTIATVEHLMAALYGLRIDNARLEVEGPEIPALDGSAAAFAERLVEAGIRCQAVAAPVIGLQRPLWLPPQNGGGRVAPTLLALPAGELTLTVATDFARPLAGPSVYTFSFGATNRRFLQELAPARTFCFEDEIALIRAAGLGGGGTVENTIVVSDTGTSTPLRYPDELARHKALDLLGDLALVGGRLAAHVIALYAGHSLHVAMAREIRKQWTEATHAQD